MSSTLRDPLAIGAFRRLIHPDRRQRLTRSLTLNTVTGVLEGIALITLLPLATTLTAGGSSWGLGFTAWLWVLLGLAVVTAVVRYANAYIGYGVALDVLRSVHGQIGDHLARLPLGWFHKGHTGGLSRLVSDGVMAAGSGAAHLLPSLMSNGATMLTVLVGSWLWDLRLGLTLTIAAPLGLGIMLGAQRIRVWASDRAAPTEQELADRIVEFAQCQPALRAAGRATDFPPMLKARRDNDSALLRELAWSTVAILLNGVVVQAIVVTLISIAGALAVDGAMEPVAAVVYIGMVLRFTRNLQEVGSMLTGMDHPRRPLREIMSILDAPTLPEPAASTTLTAPGSVELDAVTFGYRPDRPVIREVSFIVPAGTMTALVGPSGSGKTTVARLISRFWEADAGTIRVGGADIQHLTTEDLMAQLSMVFQDVYLFDDTLEANVRVGRPEATDEEVRHAARLAGVTEIADRLPDGWSTRVGEGGRALSGGERQRVSVARALLKQAPIVLFDEATSALDAENEANIVASVSALRQSSTFLVIAHKLDTVRGADQIIVLDEDGRVAERGTHEELFSAGGAYRRFWDRRQQATGWSLSAGQ